MVYFKLSIQTIATILVMGLSVSFEADLSEKFRFGISLEGSKFMEAIMVTTSCLAVSTGFSGVCSSDDFPKKKVRCFYWN